MMSWHRFMQRKRHHLPLGASIWFVKINEVGSCAAAVRSTLRVISGGGVRSGRHWNRFHAIGLPRQHSEHLHQLRIDLLGDSAVGGEKFVSGSVIELWVSAKVCKELLQSAFKTDLHFDLLHLSLDTRDFAQADLVDLLRSLVGGGVFSRGKGVILGTIRILPHAHLVI